MESLSHVLSASGSLSHSSPHLIWSNGQTVTPCSTGRALVTGLHVIGVRPEAVSLNHCPLAGQTAIHFSWHIQLTLSPIVRRDKALFIHLQWENTESLKIDRRSFRQKGLFNNADQPTAKVGCRWFSQMSVLVRMVKENYWRKQQENLFHSLNYCKKSITPQ